MIKGFARIKGLAVYEDYTKPAGTQDFAHKNLIYGWNYSGKTTLSRLFALLESKVANPDLTGCSFTIETNSKPITEVNFAQCDLIVRVFNSDFVRQSLNFAGQSFKPILLLGKESEEAQKNVDHCEDLLKRADEKARNFTKQASDIESSMSAARTAAAAKIKRTLGLVDAYTATHLSSDITKIESLGEPKLLDDEIFRDDVKLALTPDSEKPSTVERLGAYPSINSLRQEATIVLAAVPNLSGTINTLLIIRSWRSGLRRDFLFTPAKSDANSVSAI